MDAEVHVILAKAYAAVGDTESAFEYYQRVLQIKPQDVETPLRLARVFLRQGKVDAAEQALRTALDIHPDHPALLDGLSELQSGSDPSGDKTATSPP